MNVYISGKIMSTSSTGIVFEHNDVGIFINMNANKNMELFKLIKIFVYDYIINNYKFIYGFNSLEERSMFIDLLRVNKIGPKIALGIIKKSSYEDFKILIKEQNVSKIKQSLEVSDKQSMNIMIDLKERYEWKNINSSNKFDVIKALKKIGYKKEQIDLVIDKINLEKNNLEDNVKDAIRRISVFKNSISKNANT